MSSIPGGNYIAEYDQLNESYTIKDVPIMAELPEGARENPEIISTAWFRACVKRHAQLEKQGYVAPCHLNHHDLGRETPRIGFLKPTGVGSVLQDGIEVPALMADLVGLKEEHIEAIQNNDLAYRSVEIASWDRAPEISSLALLSDEAPWYKLPLLNLGDIRPAPMEVGVCSFEEENTPLVAMRDGAALLFRFQEKKMSETAEQLATRRGRVQKFANDNGDNGNGKKKDDDDSGDDSVKLQEGTDATAAAVAELISEFQAKLPQLVGEYLDGLVPTGGEGLEESLDAPLEEEEPMPIELQEDAEPEEEEDDDKPPIPLRGKNHYSEGKTQMLAELAGRVAALETEQKARQDEDSMAALITGATQSLRDSGWSVPDTAVAAMREIASGAKNPQATVQKFTESYKQHAPRDPAVSFEALEGIGGGSEEDVLKFAEAGPETLEKARKLAAEYDELKASGFDFTVTREDHIRENLRV